MIKHVQFICLVFVPAAQIYPKKNCILLLLCQQLSDAYVYIFIFSYNTEVTPNEEIVRKLTTGENPPVNRVYKPEFVTLAPPILYCQDEVTT